MISGMNARPGDMLAPFLDTLQLKPAPPNSWEPREFQKRPQSRKLFQTLSYGGSDNHLSTDLRQRWPHFPTVVKHHLPDVIGFKGTKGISKGESLFEKPCIRGRDGLSMSLA